MAGAVNTLFLDVGGVLLTNGWDRQARQRAAETFGLDPAEMNDRHRMTFDTYETGKLSLDDYLTRVVFFEKRAFTREAFTAFMFAQSEQLPNMIEYVLALKKLHNLRVAIISNEGHELTEHRVRTFPLSKVADFFIFSCYVHLRKPDVDIFRLALNVAQVEPSSVAYLDDRAMFAEVAASLGIHGIHHESVDTTRRKLADLGLTLDER
ncbi:MAG: HAD family phosphatase [Phycisphaerales bacterium]|nr:HAD family phosphatase [Phycisphaerales bacterium]MCB9863191.1 HAD family phosphatase [Phycisphaerales bacterium]